MADPIVESGSEQAQQKGQPKALRFVTNYGAPHPKRRRIGAACLTCRKRKTACSGEKPYCATCKQNKLECVGYSAEAQSASQSQRRRTTSDVGMRQAPVADMGSKSRSGSLNWPSPPVFGRQEAGASEDLHHKAPRRPNGHAHIAGQDSAQQPAHINRGRERNVQPLFAGPRNRMPYFRWLGPTAIMPGFKQMVVKVKRQENDLARSSTEGTTLSPSLGTLTGDQGMSSIYSNTPAPVESDVRTPLNLPFYDTSPMPPSELITHLGNTFFSHLGCNYPFLQRDRFLRDLEEKQVDAILVDAVCALAARFSTHPLLKQQPHDEARATPAEYGHAFAQRAKTALLDTFACPSVAAVQAALLLAYNEFGESRDSGLWMYLGIAIRMAQDLGMHKLEGLRYKGIAGPTPKMFKRMSVSGGDGISPAGDQARAAKSVDFQGSVKDVDEQKAVEQERVDTFWAVFFLDRVVSSGTGRRSTLRDKDIELSFPDLNETDPTSGWPAVFPALIRIVHLYGRVADLLNSLKEPSDITAETPQRLAMMEKQVTEFYQGLSQRLHFDAVNFQHYMKAGEGTNFVLLHFWFHTMIVLLHQPTLLMTFEGRMLQLFPNSQQLSLSSAKTIADILSYSQLMDAKASLGNPFTTQPIYIAACAFLKETAEQTATSNAQSRANSPSRSNGNSDSNPSRNGTPKTPGTNLSNSNGKATPVDQKALAKHTLLATAASQHYQLCYKALQSLETYWSGTKYILTVLDQKFEGVGDPLLYTVEEGESAMERPRPEPAFTSPGWRRKLSWGPYLSASPFLKAPRLSQVPGSPGVDPSKAIGWTLTGTMNSPSTNLAWHYANAAANGGSAAPELDPAIFGRGGGYSNHLPAISNAAQDREFVRPTLPSLQRPKSTSTVSTADANLLLGLGSPYPSRHGTPTNNNNNSLPFPQGMGTPQQQAMDMPFGLYPGNGSMQSFGDMLIESQDVDMSMLGLDMNMPWFDAFPALQEGGGVWFEGGGEQAQTGARDAAG